MLLIAAGIAGVACGDEGTPPDPTPTVGSLTFSTIPSTSSTGSSVPFTVVIRDDGGRPLSGMSIRFDVMAGGGTADPASAVSDASGSVSAVWNVGASPGVHQLRASSGSKFAEAILTVVEPPPDPVLTTLLLEGVPASARTFETLDVTAVALDQTGGPMPGISVTTTVVEGAGTVAEGENVTGADGRVAIAWTLGLEAGPQRLLVTSGTHAAEASVTAIKPALGGFGAVTGGGQEGPVGRELAAPIVVEVLDDEGQPYGGLALTWTVVSGNGTIAPEGQFTGADGKLAGRWTLGSVVGQQRLEIMADDGQGRVTAVVISANAFDGVRIFTDLPVMRRTRAVDVSMTARGGAEETGYTWSVTAGILPPGLDLSADGVLGGVPTVDGVFPFTIRATDIDGIGGERAYDARICQGALLLAVGEVDITTYPNPCPPLLPASDAGTYRVGVMARGQDRIWTREVAGGLALNAATEGQAAMGAGLRVDEPQLPQIDGSVALQIAPDPTTGWYHEETIEAVGRSFRPRVNATGTHAALLADPAPHREFLVFGDADQLVTVGATLRAFSETVAYYEEDGLVAAGGTRYSDQDIQEVLAYHDLHSHPVLTEAFGGYGPPGTVQVFTDDAGNVLDKQVGDLDGNGRLVALQLRLDWMRGAIGFVAFCDLVPRPEHAVEGFASCPASNESEIIYVRAPGKALFAHEAKHVSSGGWFTYGGREPHRAPWIEEGTAVLASELASRHAAGVAPTQRIGAADVYVAGQRPVPDDPSYLMWAATVTGYNYLAAAPFSGITGDPNPNPNGSSFYGASWLFHRYVLDQYGAGDPHGLMRRLNTVSGGVAGLEAETGRPIASLFTELMEAALVDDEPAARSAAAHRFQSYDFGDIIESDPAGVTWPPFIARVGFGAGTWDLPTWETSSNLFEFVASGTQDQLLSLTRGDGTEVTPEHDVALLVVRVR
ncbi:MAG: Ig domain-containing protein [Gemmatimonadota bacterium]